MKKVGVVVLNYNNYKDTMNCVDSFLNQADVNMHVVVVDNGSKNNSYDLLSDKFEHEKAVEVISTRNNLGFAKGMNVGICRLRELEYSFVFVANSDIFLTEKDILKKMLLEYEKGVGLINPIIRNPDGNIEKRSYLKKKIMPLRMIKAQLLCEWNVLFYRKDKMEKDNGKEDSTSAMNGVVTDMYIVSGSGYMLTPDFFRHYSQLFPKTFLYGEEWALIVYLYKAGLLSQIVMTNEITHKGGASTPDDMGYASKKKFVQGTLSGRIVIKLLFMSKRAIQLKYN